MRVIASPINPPAALIYQNSEAVLIIRSGILAAGVVMFLDRLLTPFRILT